MVRYSVEVLDLFGAPGLSKLTTCGAGEVDDCPAFLLAAVWNHIFNLNYPDPAVLHLDLLFLRRANAAVEEYKAARTSLINYIEGVSNGEHRLKSYHSSLTHFEQCIGATWQAAELFNRIENKISDRATSKLSLYQPGQFSALERINQLNNRIKHFNATQAAEASAPIWITNEGLNSTEHHLTFAELKENLSALIDVARQTFVEFQAEVIQRSKSAER